MYHVFFSLSSVDGHLGGFHVFALVNSGAMNIGMPVSFHPVFFSQINAQDWDSKVIW